MKNLSFIENDAFVEWNRLIRDFKKAESKLKRVTLEKETLIQQYIKPFFQLLGWTLNKKNPLHLEKIDPALTPGKPSPPDYLLINKHQPLFFIDVKKPAFPIKEQKERAFQLRRFSFSANLPIAVSTDFEEFALFDCRIKPELEDDLETTRLFYCDIDSLFTPCQLVPGIRNIDFLFSVFSSSALTNHHFRQFLDEMPTPSYLTNVNHELFKAIESWHFILFQELAALNPFMTKTELNQFTSHFILTLLYWRFQEDTNQEKYATLYQVSLSEDPWKSLRMLCENKKLIYPSDMEIISSVQIGRETLYSILQQLYYPESPFEFSVITPASYLRIFSSLKHHKKTNLNRLAEYPSSPLKEETGFFSSVVTQLLQFKLISTTRKKTPPWIPIWSLDEIASKLYSAMYTRTKKSWKLDYSFCEVLSPDLTWLKTWFPPLPDHSEQFSKEALLYLPYSDSQSNKELIYSLQIRIQQTLPHLSKVVLLFDLRWTNCKPFQQFWQDWTNLIFPKAMHLYQQGKQGFVLVLLSPVRKPKQILFTKHQMDESFRINQTILQPISLDSIWQ